MSDLRKAAEQMLECLLYHYNAGNSNTITGVRLKLDEKAIREARAALAAPRPEPVPVSARHRFRHPRNGPDWGKWYECSVRNRPAWEIDSQGYEVEYRPLYAAPPAAAPDNAEALRRDAERYRRLLNWLVKTGLLSRERCRIDTPESLGDWWILRKPKVIDGSALIGYGKTEDAAIDAAMENKS
jgi:hypothetical protein